MPCINNLPQSSGAGPLRSPSRRGIGLQNGPVRGRRGCESKYKGYGWKEEGVRKLTVPGTGFLRGILTWNLPFECHSGEGIAAISFHKKYTLLYRTCGLFQLGVRIYVMVDPTISCFESDFY